MELVILGLVVLGFYALIRFGASATSWVGGGRYRAYRALARAYRGSYQNRGLYDPPTVSFSHKGSSVRVGLAPQVAGQPALARTRVVARFGRGLPLRMELAPVTRPAPAQPPKGTRPVRCGDAAFDREFVIQANDAEMAREFLALDVRWAIGNLARLGPPGGMLISINPERLLVQVDRNLGPNADALAAAVAAALEIHDGLQNGVAARLSQGISIVAIGAAGPEDSGPPICKVCGEPIPDPEVVCTTCKTPHHRDCWEFVGSCSIFGCRGKHAVPAAGSRRQFS